MGAPITSLALSMNSVFAAAGDWVGRYVRGKEIGRFVTSTSSTTLDSDSDSESDSDSDSDSDDSSSTSSDDSDMSQDASSTAHHEQIHSLTLFGTTLVALSVSGARMYVWDIPPFVHPASKAPSSDQPAPSASQVITPYATLEFPPGFTATKVVHPASYLNKVVVGSKEGELAVWNVRTGYVPLQLRGCDPRPDTRPSPDRAELFCTPFPHPPSLQLLLPPPSRLSLNLPPSMCSESDSRAARASCLTRG